jgi:hypothetical protein
MVRLAAGERLSGNKVNVRASMLPFSGGGGFVLHCEICSGQKRQVYLLR